MHTEPNYEKYSLDELFDAQQNVDSARYPDRAAKITTEIERRKLSCQENGQENSQKTRDAPIKPRDLGLGRRTVAAYLVVSGVISFALILDAIDWRGGGVESSPFLVESLHGS